MPTVQYLASFAGFITGIINGIIVPLIFAIAFLVFVWGVYTYFIAGAGDPEKRKEGKNFVLYGLVGFFVMVSIWGLVNILVRTFGFGGDTRPPLPSFGAPRSGGSGNGNAPTTVLTCSPESAYNPAGLSPDECCARAFGPGSTFSAAGCTNSTR